MTMAIDEQSHPEWVALTWELEEDAGKTIVTFHGEIDENVDFGPLRSQLAGSVIFDLENVQRINSCGVREWVNFVRDLTAVSELTFTRCSPATVTQLNMIYNFRGNAKVLSVYAPYICENCDSEEDKLIDLAEQFTDGVLHELPELRCRECEEPMEFDEIPERYLSFLLEP